MTAPTCRPPHRCRHKNPQVKGRDSKNHTITASKKKEPPKRKEANLAKQGIHKMTAQQLGETVIDTSDMLSSEARDSVSKMPGGRVKPRRSPGPKRKSERVSAPRVRELNELYTPSAFEKESDDEDIIRTELARNFIFKKKASNALESWMRAFEPIDSYRNGDVIIEQGDVGDYFYILGKGSVVYENEGKEVGSSDKPGTSFGELALLYESPRAATVRATSDNMRVFRVDQLTFRYICQSRSKFKALGMQAVTKVKAANRLLSFIGRSAKGLVVSDDDETDDEADQRKVEERFQIQKEPSTQETAKDEDSVEDYNQYMDKLVKRRSYIRTSLEGKDLSVDTFRRNSILGSGSYGEVWLVNPKIEDIDREQFALKIQSKKNMEREKQFEYTVEEAIRRECNVLRGLCHPMIVNFVHDFEDDDNMYMVLGVIKGLELWDCIHRQQNGEWISGFQEEDTKFYAILIADTLAYMHQQKICHRDIKPENVMVDLNGYPIIIDFGFAKVLPENVTYTLCGTPKYTAPEVIENDGHGCPVDNWSLGVVIYEMLSGENPFWYEGIQDLQLLDDICNADPFPLENDVAVSEEAMDIVLRLLEKDPNRRLSGADITSHPWFHGFDLERARKMELPAPWTPPEPEPSPEPEQ